MYIYIYIYISDKEKQLFWKLKFYAVLSTIFSQLTLTLNFLTSRNLNCTRMKNTPQSHNDSAHRRTLQKFSTPQVSNGAATPTSPPPMLNYKTVVYIPLPH